MKNAIVITTINGPTKAVETIAKLRPDWNFIVVGDRKTPADWSYPGANFLSLDQQQGLGGRFVELCPLNHYARKNIGYIKAIRDGAELIAETDDDNIPYDNFLSDTARTIDGQLVARNGWENVYTHFTEDKIWPRGFPLELINESLTQKSPLREISGVDCPIQQFLADGDPDVDAIYRLTIEAETKFGDGTIFLARGTFCPFNSQNTVFWPEAFPLLYLPSYVSFRMTDIWRSFVAQECVYRFGGHVAFRHPTVLQVRNAHSYIRDFADEIPGYLNNVKIVETLADLTLSAEKSDVGANLRRCYEALVELGVVPEKEMSLVDAWLADIA